MKVWTTQSEKVISQILEKKIYQPDFRLSDGFGGEKMKPAYDGMLEVYNSRNSLKSKGLIFGISMLNDKIVNSIAQFKEYFRENSFFWDSVSRAGQNYAILELEIPDKVDLVPIYFQDFIILGMRATRNDEFTEYTKPSLCDIEYQDFNADVEIAQNVGWTTEGYDFDMNPILNRITQAHYHEIKLENVKGVYETFDYDKEIEYPLGKSAVQLREIISNS